MRQKHAVPAGEQARGSFDVSAGSRTRALRSSSVRPRSSRISMTSSPSAATASRHTPIPPAPATDVGDEVVHRGRAERGQVASRHVRVRLGEVDLRPLHAEPVGRHRVPRAPVTLAIVRHVDHRHEGREVAPVDSLDRGCRSARPRSPGAGRARWRCGCPPRSAAERDLVCRRQSTAERGGRWGPPWRGAATGSGASAGRRRTSATGRRHSRRGS